MKRVVTALFLIPIAVYSALFAPWWVLFGVIALVALLCFREYATITGSFAPLGYVAGLLILAAPQHETILLIILSTLAAMCLMLFADDPAKGFTSSAALALGTIYIFGAWKTGILLHDINANWLMFGLLVNWVGDTGAFYVGRKFGRHKLAPSVSPGKSWEGAVASAVTGVVFGAIYLPLTIKGTSLVTAMLLALAANAAGQVGDLAESAIKRGTGVKDSGSLLPGHGGILDRVDSTLFALPVLYSLLTFFR
ncbi:MAG TPA: phosphatidate cytidylyltransferase [Bryobacteraceae bacterium]|jgi:phosphatidate cytidylyltransferase|nr:phosphatidate cytidylyltransferase [Bryobacteraceae bacterium]